MALSEADALQAVKSVIAAHGGEVEHSQLMNDLVAQGAYEARPFVRQFQQQKRINAKLTAVPGERARLTYTDPDAVPTGGGE